MPRPQKCRRVCQMPINCNFHSMDSNEHVDRMLIMSVEEYEAIRLIDYVGCTQEECAKQMNVARSTVQGIYNDARKKLSRFLVEGVKLQITGGYYELCKTRECDCQMSECGYNKNRMNKGERNMKIAVTYENGQVFQHFGQSKQFKIYETENGEILSTKIIETNGNGHGALADFLKTEEVSTLICGGIGGGAKNTLAEAKIQLFGGASGDADKQIESFLAGNLSYNPNVECNHHGDHHEGDHHDHKCGNHGGE